VTFVCEKLMGTLVLVLKADMKYISENSDSCKHALRMCDMNVLYSPYSHIIWFLNPLIDFDCFVGPY
jgi:hypothetical protein